MKPSILPITRTSIDWDTFLDAAHQSLGYSPLKGVDSSGRNFSDPAKFLAAVAGLQGGSGLSDPSGSIRRASFLHRHLSYGFILHCDEELLSQIRQKTDLTITSAVSVDEERIAVVSGTLLEYRDGALECCTPDSPFNLRLLFDFFVIFFEREGLGDVWDRCTKKTLTDKTFLLTFQP